MTNLQKARMNLYETMASGKTEDILKASQKLDKLVLHQMHRLYGKKKAFIE